LIEPIPEYAKDQKLDPRLCDGAQALGSAVNMSSPASAGRRAVVFIPHRNLSSRVPGVHKSHLFVISALVGCAPEMFR